MSSKVSMGFETVNILEFSKTLADLQEKIRSKLNIMQKLPVTEVKVGPSVIRSFDIRGEVRKQFPSLSLVVTPDPARYLLSPKVAYEFFLGLRGSDLYARRWSLSITSPEITLHSNFVLALVSLFGRSVNIRIRLSSIHLTANGISVNITSDFNSAKQIQEHLSVLYQHNKYDMAHLEGYTPYSFIGHWIGDKYCKFYKKKNILEIGFVMKPSNLNYVDFFINKYTSVLGGKHSDFRYIEDKCILMIRGETRIHLLRMIFSFYEQLEPFRTTAVNKVFLFIQNLIRYRYLDINIKPLPRDIIRHIRHIELKKYGKDIVIDIHLTTPSKEEANIMALSLRSFGYNVFVHGYKLRLYNYRTMLILKEQIRAHATITGSVGVSVGTVIQSGTTIRGPVVIGEHCEIGPNAYIGPYTSIGDHVRIANTEIENSIVMSGALIDCGHRITDSLIGKNVEITDSNQFVPKGHKLILGDASKVTL